MNRYRHAKSSLFLMEIMLNIFFFIIIAVFCLQLFRKANQLSEYTTELHQSVTVCTSIAEVCQSSPDIVSAALAAYPYATGLEHTILIYFDSSFLPCEESLSIYRASVSLSESSSDFREASDSSAREITFSRIRDAKELYTLTFSSYKALTPASLIRGEQYE